MERTERMSVEQNEGLFNNSRFTHLTNLLEKGSSYQLQKIPDILAKTQLLSSIEKAGG